MAESKTYAELEIAVDRRFDGELTVHLRFSEPNSDSEESFESTIPLKFDFEALRQTEDDAAAYGRLLSASLFADPKVREKLEHARSFAAALRLRLFIGLGAKDLHALRWETLRHPGDDSSLTSSERVLFSRYLSSYDWRRVSRRARGQLRALVAIANPTRKGSDRAEHAPLAPIDVAAELQRAEKALAAEIPVATVDAPVTLDRLIAAVRDHRPDILYVVCHGGRLDGNPVLYLEGETTWVEVVAAAAFATALQQLEHQPRLVVLASCQSAGSDRLESEDGALVSLGPRLAESGIPAVVAMQGAVQIGTVAAFMQAFFADLRQHGEIDLAMAHARNAVQDQTDFWMPVLFHRLKDGRIWYEPSFVQDDGFQKWPALIQLIKSGYCTPILGTGMTDAVFGTRREIARRWAEAYDFPLAPQDREDLPQVAQYLTVKLTEFFPFEDLKDQVRQGLLQHHRGELPAGLPEAELSVIAAAVGRQMRENDHEPHRVLAGLDLPVFITTNPDNLLADALQDAGKEPHVELFHWSGNDEIVWPPSLYDDPANTYKPSAQQPLVYHLFGHLDYLDTLVLTEDDYFDFLIGFTKNRHLIPEVVRSALTKNALLFVGFEMDDWDFRVIFRSIVNMEGIGASRRFGSRGRLKLFHVGVQVAPDEGRFVAAESARKYIEKYFGSDRNNISIYWGNPADFAGDLLAAKRSGSPRGSPP